MTDHLIQVELTTWIIPAMDVIQVLQVHRNCLRQAGDFVRLAHLIFVPVTLLRFDTLLYENSALILFHKNSSRKLKVNISVTTVHTRAKYG